MNEIKTEVVIVGAGLSGLTAAYQLDKAGVGYQIIEARDTIGGRINTLGFDQGKPVEMGATWLGAKHKAMTSLMGELGVGYFEQVIGDTAIYEAISTSPHYLARLPHNPEPSLRVQGGTMSIIDKLYQGIDADCILLGEQVRSISYAGDGVVIKTSIRSLVARSVISTVPPNLLVNTIDFEPKLPEKLTQLAKQTHTWMGESIKIALVFEQPFWRSPEYSGTIISNVGPIPEMYDHSNVEDDFYALMGFLNGSYASLTKEQRKAVVLKQLRKYFGSHVDTCIAYHEVVWRAEEYTFYPYEQSIIPHQNQGHKMYQQSYFDGHLVIAGTETDPQFPGYMDGAISAGIRASNQVMNLD